MKKLAVAALSLVCVVSWATAFFASTDTTMFEPAKVVSADLPRHVLAGSEWALRAQPAATLKNPIASAITLAARPVPAPQVLGAAAYRVDQLTNEQALDLDKPGVIMIINSLGGGYKIPDFDIDLQTFALTPRPDLGIHTTPINDVAYGSGFFVNPDGYAVSNAHVISKQFARMDLETDLLNHWPDVYQYELSQLSSKDLKAYQQVMQQKYGNTVDQIAANVKDLLVSEVNKFVDANAVDNVTQKLVVVNKTQNQAGLTKNQELDQVIAEGLPASVVGFDQQYQDSGADIALVKVEAQNAPALPVGSSDNLSSGDKVFTLGYPSTAQVDNSDYFEPTLTQGVVSSIKTYKKQKAIILDNKISPGSSGSPLFDAHGSVVGVITYVSDNSQGGDDFGSALPIELAKDLMAQHQVINQLGVYGSSMMLGWAQADQHACQSAISSFNTAQQADSRFNVGPVIAKYVKSCQDLIAAGESNDSSWDNVRLYFKHHAANAAVFGALGLVLLILVIWLAVVLVRHWRTQRHEFMPAPMAQPQV
ncbi:MAG: serine protease [Patescibacteria group bacterium]|nr:serine protease [Patescibacteria group bacterium]